MSGVVNPTGQENHADKLPSIRRSPEKQVFPRAISRMLETVQDSRKTDKVSAVWKLRQPWLTNGKNRGGFQERKRNDQPLFEARSVIDAKHKEVAMLRWALAFFVVALIAAVFGFTGVALASAGIAKILFFIFLVLFLLSLVGHLLRRV